MQVVQGGWLHRRCRCRRRPVPAPPAASVAAPTWPPARTAALPSLPPPLMPPPQLPRRPPLLLPGATVSVHTRGSPAAGTPVRKQTCHCCRRAGRAAACRAAATPHGSGATHFHPPLLCPPPLLGPIHPPWAHSLTTPVRRACFTGATASRRLRRPLPRAAIRSLSTQKAATASHRPSATQIDAPSAAGAPLVARQGAPRASPTASVPPLSLAARSDRRSTSHVRWLSP